MVLPMKVTFIKELVTSDCCRPIKPFAAHYIGFAVLEKLSCNIDSPADGLSSQVAPELESGT